MTATMDVQVSDETGRAGFAALLDAEWTKFRTVRGWPVGLLIAALLTIVLGFVVLDGPSPCGSTPTGCVTEGPGGEAVVDHFALAYRELPADGSITVRVSSLTGVIPDFDAPEGADPAAGAEQPGLVPWAKAGVIIKQSTEQGSPYAAIMLTGGHGVRMQSNYTVDIAGSPAPAADRHWLRLTRSGQTITGDESSDGSTWTQVGTAELSGDPRSVLVGMFVASPDYEVTTQQIGGTNTIGGQSRATATFDSVRLQGAVPAANWTGVSIEGTAPSNGSGGGPGIESGSGAAGVAADQAQLFAEAAGTFTVTGSGDIAPAVAGPGGNTIERGLIGIFAALVVVLVVGASFMTAEYRRGLIRTTFTATPQRGRVLAAKAIVLFAVSFVTGLVAAAVAVLLITAIRRGNGAIVLPVSLITELRVVVGTAAMLAVAAVFALAIGAILRRGAAAVTVAVVVIVLPYLLSVASVLPAGPAQWLLRITPAAGFAIQQSTPEYAQVDIPYLPSTGFFPLAPLAGLAVLCAWTAIALGLAAFLMQRRDA